MKTDTINYGTGKYNFRKQSLIRYKSFWDFNYVTGISGFVITGTEPEGTTRRIVFEIEGELYRFVNNILDRYIWRGEIEDILRYGNTVGELLELPNLDVFLNRKVKPVIALAAAANLPVMPKINIKVKASSYNDIYTKIAYSPIFELVEKARLISVSENKTVLNNATATNYFRLKKISGEWGDWQYLGEAVEEKGSAMQFRTNYVVTTLDGTDFARVGSISLEYQELGKSSALERVIVSRLENYSEDLKTCYLLVKHTPLLGSVIKGYVSMKGLRGCVEDEELGYTTGEEQEFKLEKGLVMQETIHLEVDGVATKEYEFDTGESKIKMRFGVGKLVRVSYEYTSGEKWEGMTLDYETAEESRYVYRSMVGGLKEVGVKVAVRGLSEITGYVAGFSI